MVVLATTALVMGAAAGAGAVAFSRAMRRLELPFEPDEMHWARTKDGWELPVARYAPRGPRAVAEPVILCHGLGANRYNLDLNERYSVARYLAKRGFETFVVELRGNGISHRVRKGPYYRFRFDDLVQRDLPALIDKVRGISGAPRVLWVGHSKGGIVQYAYCGMKQRPEIAGVVAIGSPFFTPETYPPAFSRMILAGSRLLIIDALYTSRLLKVFAPFGALGGIRFRYMGESANIDANVTAWAMANLLGNISTGVARQFLRWIETGRFTSWDGRIDYGKGLAASKVPFLLIAGNADLLGPPASLRAARAAMKEADAAGLVEYLEAGVEQGFACDYGHGDLVLGRCAPDEIFPRIEGWLRSRGTRVAPSAPSHATGESRETPS